MLSSPWRCSDLKRTRCRIWRRRNIWSRGMTSLPLLCNSKRRTKHINLWRKNSGPWHQLQQGRLCFSCSASKLTTLAMDSMFFFADRLLHIQVVFRVTIKNDTVDVGYLWYLGCIIYHLLFGSPLCNVDSQQINSLLSIFLYNCFYFFAMFMLLLLFFLELMLLI